MNTKKNVTPSSKSVVKEIHNKIQQLRTAIGNNDHAISNTILDEIEEQIDNL